MYIICKFIHMKNRDLDIPITWFNTYTCIGVNGVWKVNIEHWTTGLLIQMYAQSFDMYGFNNFHFIYVYNQSAARCYVCNPPQHFFNHVDRGVNTPLFHVHVWKAGMLRHVIKFQRCVLWKFVSPRFGCKSDLTSYDSFTKN